MRYVDQSVGPRGMRLASSNQSMVQLVSENLSTAFFLDTHVTHLEREMGKKNNI